jgi:hypothetical protein
MGLKTRPKQQEKQEFLIAEPNRARCKICGATLHYDLCGSPLVDFLVKLYSFYEAHENCGG